MRIAVIGAGMAGLACAERLRAGGRHDVRLFDKGRAAGGRMSSRRMPTTSGEATFDHGAQYFTARDPLFATQVAKWRSEGLVAQWPEAGQEVWVGTPAMNAPVKALAEQLDVRWSIEVDAIARDPDGWRLSADEDAFDAIVVAVPAEQAAPLLTGWDDVIAARAAAARSMPCWTVMAAFADRIPFGADVLREHKVIGWAARNSAKPGRHAPESWVIQAGPEWSVAHLEDERPSVTSALLDAFSQRVGVALPQPLAAAAHRWRYAKSGNSGEGAIWNPALRLGACGDWLLGPRVECAWLSGRRLAEQIDGT